MRERYGSLEKTPVLMQCHPHHVPYPQVICRHIYGHKGTKGWARQGSRGERVLPIYIYISDVVPDRMSEHLSGRMADRMSESILDKCQIDCQIECQNQF